MQTRLFAVLGRHVGAWDHALPMEEQPSWKEHAQLMDSWTEEGFIALGGPLEGSDEVLLIMRARSVEEIIKRFAADPWVELGLLQLTSIKPWHLRLGSIA